MRTSNLARLPAWYLRRRSGTTVLLTWFALRMLAVVVLTTTREQIMVGDVFYYWRKLSALGEVGLAGTLNEYPTPVVWLLGLPYALVGGHRPGYLVAFILFMLALDAAFTWAVWRASGPRDGAVEFWLLYVLLLGPLCYVRFDLLPAVLAGGAVLAARHRPWVAGALTGLGAAIKLWPALLIPAFLAHRPDRKVAGWSFVGVGIGLALVSLLAGGWRRLVSPLTWQSGRGLQIESVWATPLMLARAVRGNEWAVDMSRYQAYEVFGPGVAITLLVSNVATVLGLLAIAALFARAFRHPAPSAVPLALVILATVAIMTVTNKTLSPQYLLWLGGPMAALLVLSSGVTAAERGLIRTLSWQLLGLALLTHLVYPLLYDGLLGRQGGAMIVVSTAVTTVRNLALVAFTLEASYLAWSSLSRRR